MKESTPTAETEQTRRDAVHPTGTEAEVCADIAARQVIGIGKYGTTVADNPLPLREWLEHAYQETLDKAVYLKRAISEIDRQAVTPPVPATTRSCG